MDSWRRVAGHASLDSSGAIRAWLDGKFRLVGVVTARFRLGFHRLAHQGDRRGARRGCSRRHGRIRLQQKSKACGDRPQVGLELTWQRWAMLVGLTFSWRNQRKADQAQDQQHRSETKQPDRSCFRAAKRRRRGRKFGIHSWIGVLISTMGFNSTKRTLHLTVLFQLFGSPSDCARSFGPRSSAGLISSSICFTFPHSPAGTFRHPFGVSISSSNSSLASLSWEVRLLVGLATITMTPFHHW